MWTADCHPLLITTERVFPQLAKLEASLLRLTFPELVPHMILSFTLSSECYQIQVESLARVQVTRTPSQIGGGTGRNIKFNMEAILCTIKSQHGRPGGPVPVLLRLLHKTSGSSSLSGASATTKSPTSDSSSDSTGAGGAGCAHVTCVGSLRCGLGRRHLWGSELLSRGCRDQGTA